MSHLPRVTVLTMDTEDAAVEAGLEALLPDGTRQRLAAFTHQARRRQSLWGRFLALAEARRLGAELIEEPPYPPYLRMPGGALELSIAHTGTFVAVGTASPEDPVMGLDLEGVRPLRRLEAVCDMSLGIAARPTIEACRRTGSTDPFFFAWGLMESQVKLNRGGARFRLVLDAEGRPAVSDEAGRLLRITHRKFDQLRLTVLTSALTPVIRRRNASELTRLLLPE
ncbi:MAG: hypothetical protein ACI4SY_02365 [Sutterella sp.]